MFRNRRWASLIALFLPLALVAAACGDDDTASGDTDSQGDNGSGISGTLDGAGASSQGAAMDGWRAGFQTANDGVTVNYDPIGSGGGREQFLTGATVFAGSDGLMDEDEFAQSQERCASDRGAIHLPHYISPIAVAFNLDGVDELNMSPDTIAGIFTDEITNWNDKAIAADNPDVDLPDMAINPVHRSDESGTTENFTEYLGAAAGDVWTDGPVEVWPYGGEGAQGTSGVVAAIEAGEGSIGYADASQVTSLGAVAVGVGDEFVPFSPEAAAKIVDVSERLDGYSEFDFQFELERDTTESGVYPIVLVSYHIVCLDYADQATADLVKAFMTYVGSADGQAAAAAEAGNAPISEDLAGQLEAAIDAIGVV
ncbi:phosphate ABC transporter substrate-binding protein PstS [Actinospongicola halichondriae]|uniref:phosphate ABC transporter substrate-binding protein PstS n=1 Tax=Actinospongicola halichondriae TaxID=3236844 RepID=UPI003D4EE7BF